MKICSILNFWSMALLCCFINLIHFGIKKITGLQFVACIERYGANREQSAFSMVFGGTLYNLFGPVAGFLGNKFGIKNVTVWGCALASLSVATCFFAEDILFVTICFGIPLGVSTGMSVFLLPSLLHFHFKANEALANGIATSGSCLGGIIFSPFYKWVLDTYGLSGSFLILGALTLQSVPAAMLLINPTREPEANEVENNTKGSFKILSKRDGDDAMPPITSNQTNEHLSNKYCHGSIQDIQDKNSIVESSLSESDQNLDYKSNFKMLNKGTTNYCHPSGATIENLATDSIDNISRNFSTASNSNTASNNKQTTLRTKTSSKPEKATRCNWGSLTVLYDPLFLLVSFIISLHMFILVLVLTVMVDFAIDKGLSMDQGVYMLMCFNVADMVGRFSLGWVTDKGYMTITNVTALSYIIMGFFFSMFAHANDFLLVMLSLAAASFVLGSMMPVFNVIISEYFKGKTSMMAMASRYIILAPLCLLVSPIIGFFRETLGSYVMMFYFIDGICIVCCIMTLLLPTFARCRKHSATQN